jgi:tetratricopeptide (TPR) repeat protein
MRARVLLALVPFAGVMGDFEAGLQAAQLAVSEFAGLRDLQGQGRVWVSKGNLLGQHGHLDEAVEAYLASLPLIAEDRWYQRLSALHGLGLCYVLKGELPQARKFSDRSVAAIESHSVSALQESGVRWLRGEILLSMGSPEGIEELRRVLDLCSKQNGSKLNLALISLRLACALWDHGRIEELGKLTSSLNPLLGSIAANNKLLQGTLAEFNSLAIRGELSRRDGSSVAA